MKKPPFTLSTKAISMIADISALAERFAIHFEKNALKLRKVNRIKTIYSSLAIEGNKLSESQVEDILDGKKVVAPLREIQEVKNAIATYDNFAKFNPFSIADFDEIQNVPELLPYIKILVDEARITSPEKAKGMFWLTGLQQFHLMKGVSESLAGRIGILNLYGLSNAEIEGRSPKLFSRTHKT